MANACKVPDRELNPLCAIIPEPTTAEYAEIRDSLKEHGQRLPIQLDADGRILDGRTRFKACQEIFKKPVFAKWKGRGSTELYAAFVWDLNGKRRHWTPQQRAVAAAKMANISHGGHNKNRTEDTKNAEKDEKQVARAQLAQPITLEKAAEITGSTKGSVARVAKVMKQSPETFAKLESGKATIREAMKEIEKQEPPEDLADPFGNKLPEKVAAVYAEGGVLADIRKRIDKIREEVEAMCERSDPLVAYLMGTALQGFQAEMKSAAAKIKFAIPYCLCPKCSGDKCLACKKTGWLPKEYYEHVIPKELQWKKK